MTDNFHSRCGLYNSGLIRKKYALLERGRRRPAMNLSTRLNFHRATQNPSRVGASEGFSRTFIWFRF